MFLVPFTYAQTRPAAKDVQITYTQIDYPGAASTTVNGINTAGDMVGEYQLTVGGQNHGFLLSQGQFTSFDCAGATATLPNGINDAGQIVGIAYTADGGSKAFVYDGQTCTTIAYPGASITEGNGINNAGVIAIRAGALGVRFRGFTYSAGKFTPVIPPGQFPVSGATGINNVGQIVGYRNNSCCWDSFLQQNGKFHFINLGDAATAFDINDNGQVVGWYSTNSVQSGFVWMGGAYVSLSFPGAQVTTAASINKSGVVVGYSSSLFLYPDHGFVTSPIAPSDLQ